MKSLLWRRKGCLIPSAMLVGWQKEEERAELSQSLLVNVPERLPSFLIETAGPTLVYSLGCDFKRGSLQLHN